MRHLFYELVTWITNMVTGLDNEHLTLGTVVTWIETSNVVTVLVNICCLLAIIAVVAEIIVIGMNMYDKHKELHSC